MKKRLFIAIKLDRSILQALVAFQTVLKTELPYPGIRWVNPRLFHLTLQFLGDTEESKLPALTASLLTAARKIKPFTITFEGVGYFGSNNDIRAFWVGTKPSPDLRDLFTEVINSSAFLGSGTTARFSPHITLARGANSLTREESSHIAKNLLEKRSQEFGVTNVSSFELIESILYQTGPVYKTLKFFDLG